MERFDITQGDICGQPGLRKALQLFHEWICNIDVYPMLYDPEYVCTWFSHGMSSVLLPEVLTKRIFTFKYLHHWIDLSKVVRVCIK